MTDDACVNVSACVNEVNDSFSHQCLILARRWLLSMLKIDPSVQLQLELLMLILHLVTPGFKKSLNQAGKNNTFHSLEYHNFTAFESQLLCSIHLVFWEADLQQATTAKTHVSFIVIFLFIHLLLECNINSSQQMSELFKLGNICWYIILFTKGALTFYAAGRSSSMWCR